MGAYIGCPVVSTATPLALPGTLGTGAVRV